MSMLTRIRRPQAAGIFESVSEIPVAAPPRIHRGKPKTAKRSRSATALSPEELLAEIEADLAAVCPEYSELMKTLRRFASGNLSSESTTVLGVVSAGAAEGRTTVALNLASALSEIYGRVVFVETSRTESDHLEAEFNFPSSSDVLDAYFRSEVSAIETLTFAAKPGLRLLLAGEFASKMGSLRVVNGFRALIQELRKSVDFVVVDLPPLLQNEEGTALLPALDSVVVVVEAGKTKVHEVERVVAACEPVPVKGVILNKVSYRTPGWVRSLFTTEGQRGLA